MCTPSLPTSENRRPQADAAGLPAGMAGLRAVMARLRHPQTGCPWDLAQDFASMTCHTVEEAYEVVEAIEREQHADLAEELGDLLFHIVFYSRLAEERQWFDLDVVMDLAVEKLVRRHPHVFADAHVADARSQAEAWERHKARERAQRAGQAGHAPSALDGVGALPGLLRAEKLQRRAARAGFDWLDIQGPIAKVAEQLQEVQAALARVGDAAEPDRYVAQEVGDLLFACVNLARWAGVDSETALRAAGRKFETRFRAMEHRVSASGGSLETAGLDTLNRHWDAAKAGE